MTPRTFIFDLDGTLLDTLSDIAAAGNFALTQLDRPTHPVAEYRMMVGNGADVLMQRALGPGHASLAAAGLKHFKAHYAEHLTDTSAPYPGIADMLDALAKRGAALAVLTNKPDAAAKKIVRTLLGRWNWVTIDGHRDHVPKKPDPTAALAIAKMTGTPPGACVFVGDSSTDMKTAVNAGMIAVGVLWGYRDRTDLVNHGAQHLIAHPADLLMLF
ncbi:MAG: HAD-IA family hydrolase [Planctomycetes bacterium]|nr:HAD-IA family hydrolase [Planctomycetota bacterium]